jgi:hypothetical protein
VNGWWPVNSRVERAIADAYRDQGWTLRQCSYAFGPSVKTIAAILERAGVPRRPPGERGAHRPSLAELASALRYAQRGPAWWTEYWLPGGCDDPFIALGVGERLIGQQGHSRWTGYSPAAGGTFTVAVGRTLAQMIIWARRSEGDGELYIVGPSAAGWWYARARGGLGPGWCAPTLSELAARIQSHKSTRIVPPRNTHE